VEDACGGYESEAMKAEDQKYEVWFGEWALATDPCGMWTTGFNDGFYEQVHECKQIDCPPTYLPEEFANATVDASLDWNGPYGLNLVGDAYNVTIHNGKCWTNSDFFSDDDVKKIAMCALTSFNKHLDA